MSKAIKRKYSDVEIWGHDQLQKLSKENTDRQAIQQAAKAAVKKRVGKTKRKYALLTEHDCEQGNPCNKAHCPTCSESCVEGLLELLKSEQFQNEDVNTVAISGVGQALLQNGQGVVDLKKMERVCKRFVQRLHRVHKKSGSLTKLRVIGGVEAPYSTIANKSIDRTHLHAHLVIVGLNKAQILEALKFLREEEFNTRKAAVPIQVTLVKRHYHPIRRWASFEWVIRYALKPLLVRSSRMNSVVRKPKHQLPTHSQMKIMIGFWGDMNCTDRLILTGFRFVQGRWQLT